MKTEILKRVFTYKKDGAEKKLPDINDQWTPNKIKDYYAQSYPELINATISGPTVSGSELIYNFDFNAGTKG
jgi:PRTRC genetic system protein C